LLMLTPSSVKDRSSPTPAQLTDGAPGRVS
jgi:hypothetical protein